MSVVQLHPTEGTIHSKALFLNIHDAWRTKALLVLVATWGQKPCSILATQDIEMGAHCSVLTFLLVDRDNGAAELQTLVPVRINGPSSTLDPGACLEVD